jgi:hypothetical protein
MSSLDAVMAKLALKTGSWDAHLKRRLRHRRMAETEAMAFEDGYSRCAFGFREGDAVEADFRGRGRYYAGKITSVREDGYDVLYVDGDARGFRERRRPESVRRRSEEPEAARPETGEPVFRVGDTVWAKTYYAGAIEKVHEDATYDILYEDGEREARVAEALISKGSRLPILLAIANDDAEAVAKLATNELKAGKLTFDRCPEPVWGMAGLGLVCMYGDTPHGLELGSGFTLLDIAQSNNKQAAARALLP